jgi:branched-subunit amino acid aminotransferase/4-amino-4-deoxychorismate lyase
VIFKSEIDNILSGIAREKVIKSAKTMGYFLVEKRVFLDEVFDADEIFLVSSVSKIKPVKSVDNKHVYSFRKTVIKLTSEFENAYGVSTLSGK